MDRDFDIIQLYDSSQTSPLFRTTFDFYTPRAHFVLLANDKSMKDIKQLPREQKVELIRTVMTAKRLLDLRDAQFSIHRGSWVTSPQFHTHLCTDAATYVGIFNKLSSKPPMNEWWPSRSFVTKQWKRSSDPSRYVDNVMGYPYKSYKEKLSDADLEDPKWSLPEFEGKALAYHGSRRRIGLCYGHEDVNRDAGSMCNLVMLLDQLADSIGATANREGCHVVVDLTGRGFPGFETGEKIFGYLEVSGVIFYRCCPLHQRAKWLRDYNALPDDKVLT